MSAEPPPSVPFFGIGRENAEIEEQAGAAIAEVLRSGQMLQSVRVETFEKRLAGQIGRKHAVTVGSATDALFFALVTLGIGPGDEVLTTDLSFIASASCILRSGAKPVFVDVGDDCNLDLDRAAAFVTPRTRAIVFVHLFGGLSNPARIRGFALRHGLAVVEDASQAFGAAYDGTPAGQAGDISAFSFDPTKVLSAPGSGGCAVTDDDALAERLRRLRCHGKQDGAFIEPGYNSQMSSLTAAVLDIKRRRQPAWAEGRRAVAARYDAALDRLGLQRPRWDGAVSHAWHKYILLAANRDALRAHLASAGVPTQVHYAKPLHEEAIFGAQGWDPAEFPRATAHSRAALSLPIHGHLEDGEVAQVIGALESFAA